MMLRPVAGPLDWMAPGDRAGPRGRGRVQRLCAGRALGCLESWAISPPMNTSAICLARALADLVHGADVARPVARPLAWMAPGGRGRRGGDRVQCPWHGGALLGAWGFGDLDTRENIGRPLRAGFGLASSAWRMACRL